MLKSYFLFSGLLFIIFSCSTTKTGTSTKAPITPAGEWEFSITETPQGDFNGIMTIGQQEKSFTAKLNANGSDIHFENFSWDEPSRKAEGELIYSGTTVYFDVTMEGEEMTGNLSTGGMNFPFKATRKKS
jgi:hypothetical protein